MIKVANTWNNRLCADAALSANERLTHEGTTFKTMLPAGASNPPGCWAR